MQVATVADQPPRLAQFDSPLHFWDRHNQVRRDSDLRAARAESMARRGGSMAAAIRVAIMAGDSARQSC